GGVAADAGAARLARALAGGRHGDVARAEPRAARGGEPRSGRVPARVGRGDRRAVARAVGGDARAPAARLGRDEPVLDGRPRARARALPGDAPARPLERDRDALLPARLELPPSL